MKPKELDVRQYPPKGRKKLIFESFDNLSAGEPMILTINHSAAPLKKLFEYERKGLYNWKYLLEGPDLWKIEISKHNLDYTIGEMIDLNPASVLVFEKYELPYYGQGSIAVTDLLRNKALTKEQFITEALLCRNDCYFILKPWLWSIPRTIDFIIENHHVFIRKEVPGINLLILNLSDTFGSDFPMLKQLLPKFGEFMNEITEHMEEEEQKVFPLFNLAVQNESNSKAILEALSASVNWMEEDHFVTIESLHSIRRICNNFIPPDDSIPGIIILFNDLRRLEKDFHYHLLLENHYLFRRMKHIASR